METEFPKTACSVLIKSSAGLIRWITSLLGSRVSNELRAQSLAENEMSDR